MSFLRRSPTLALLAALVLAAGPVASAACATVADAHTEHATPTHERATTPEAPPCHEAPATPPVSGETPASHPHDCGSACCASEAPALPPAQLAMPAVAAVAVVVLAVHPAERTAEADDLPPVPPRRARSLVVDLQRFLI